MWQEPYDKKSILFFYIYVAGAYVSFLVMLCLGVHYFILGMADVMMILLCIGMVIANAWMLEARKYWKQRSNLEYKDHNDPDPRKIPRTHPLKSLSLVVIAVCVIAVFFFEINEMSKYSYYSRLKKLYRNYWSEYKGESVNITPNQALLKDWEKHIRVFPVWDQGGTIYDYDRSDDDACSYLFFRSVYDAEWEGTRAMNGYCRTLEHNGWEEGWNLVYTKEIDGELYKADLSEWDRYGKQQVCIEYTSGMLASSW